MPPKKRTNEEANQDDDDDNSTTTTTTVKKSKKQATLQAFGVTSTTATATSSEVTTTSVAVAAGSLPALISDAKWRSALASEFAKPYFKAIETFVDKAYKSETVYPPRELIFHALNLTPLDDVRVVIIGQDPYFNAKQAHGLCFSVQKGVAAPPSLNRIYKVLQKLYGYPIPKHGDLSSWAKNGVLLLNATLTVRAGEANSHKDAGWQKFTDAIIETLNKKQKNIVYILWGGFAHKKDKLIDKLNNLIIRDAHPSPLGGATFNDTKCFTLANEYLKQHGRNEVNWQIKD